MKLSWKIIISMFLVSAFSLTMLSTLMYYKYHSNLQNLVQDRFTITLLDIQNSIKSNLKLGTQLFEIDNIKNIISHSKKNDPDILSIEVFEIKKGRINSIHNTDTQTKIDPLEEKGILHSQEPIWKIKQEATTLIGVNLKDSIKKDIGGIAICYSNKPITDNEKIIFNKIYQRLAIMLLVMLVFIWFLVSVFFRKTFNTLNHMKNLLSNKKSEKLRGMDQDLSQEFQETVSKIQKEMQDLEKIEKSIDMLTSMKEKI